MPKIPLYTPSLHPDAWHQVRAPGGYEWWHFDADDVEHDRHLVAILFDGLAFHPAYLRKYSEYRKRPTRAAPPVASQFPGACFVLYEAGKIRWQFTTQYAPGRFHAALDRVEVTVGPNTMRSDEDGSLQLTMRGTPWGWTWRGPRLLGATEVSAEMTFRPRTSHLPVKRTLLSRELSGDEHHWLLANPGCDVEATITHGGESIAFRGRGYHDHNYGTGPLGPGLSRWMRGRVLLHDRTLAFHIVRPSDGRLRDEVHLLESDDSGTRDLRVPGAVGEWNGVSALGLRYPRSISFGDELQLSNARTIDVSPFTVRLKYDAIVSDGQRGAALCEIACPQRLRWPILGRLIGISIDRRQA